MAAALSQSVNFKPILDRFDLQLVLTWVMNISENRYLFSAKILRLVGYGLLLMALVDILFLLIPPKLMNPVWEFNTMGAIVERIPVTLIGMVLVYYGERDARIPIERFLLRWLSWLSLVIAIILFLTIPLSITNSFRIYYQYYAGINHRVVGQIDQLEAFKSQLKSTKTLDQIGSILQQQAQQEITIPESVNTGKLKQDILKDLAKNQEYLRGQSRSLASTKRSSLLKDCLKWNCGALIAAVLFLIIWQSTLWARLEQDVEE